jgi:hypothetical protein
MNRERRKLIMIVHGIEEITSSTTTDRTAHDQQQIQTVMSLVLPESPPTPSETLRLAEKKGGQSPTDQNNSQFICRKRHVLSRSRALKTHKDFSQAYIYPDMTLMERDESNKLRQELRTRRDNGEDPSLPRERSP